MVLVQKWQFFQLLFLGNIGQENFFYDILERKEAFLAYKNKKFKKSKNGHFFNFYFWALQAKKNVFYDILEQKDVFLGYKNKKFQKWKN